VVATALFVRQELGELGLESWCKTTGGKGLHVVVPIARRSGWDEVKEFTRQFCRMLSHKVPGQYVTNMSMAKRKGKIFLDYLRNARGATAISAYSVRARRVCPVSTPLSWAEVTPSLDPEAFTPATVVRRLSSLKHDPWEGFWTSKQALTKSMREAVGMK
jgi:bifunctional non-homologous end joining protein LigD